MTFIINCWFHSHFNDFLMTPNCGLMQHFRSPLLTFAITAANLHLTLNKHNKNTKRMQSAFVTVTIKIKSYKTARNKPNNKKHTN